MTPGETAYAAWWTAFGDGQQDLRFGEPWARLTGRQQRAWDAAAQAVRADIHEALALAVRYGQIDGDHHKAWVIDQICRILLGTEDAYRQFVRDACAGDDGPQTYAWNEGIAP